MSWIALDFIIPYLGNNKNWNKFNQDIDNQGYESNYKIGFCYTYLFEAIFIENIYLFTPYSGLVVNYKKCPFASDPNPVL